MHRRLSLAVLLLSASLCGMGKKAQTCERKLRDQGALAALKTKLLSTTGQLSDLLDAMVEEQNNKDAKPDQPDGKDDEESVTQQPSPSRQHCVGSCMGSSCFGVSTGSNSEFSQNLLFPGEQGEGFLRY